MKVSGFSWVGLATDDFDRSMAFFRDVMGLEAWFEAEKQAILRTTSGDQLEIFGRDEAEKSLTRTPVVAFEVDDFDAARDELRAAAIELIGEGGSWNGYSWQYFRSPDGHIFEIKTSPK